MLAVQADHVAGRPLGIGHRLRGQVRPEVQKVEGASPKQLDLENVATPQRVRAGLHRGRFCAAGSDQVNSVRGAAQRIVHRGTGARIEDDLRAAGATASADGRLQQEVASTSPEALMAKREAVIQSIETFAKQAWETGRVAEWMQEADPLLAQVLLGGSYLLLLRCALQRWLLKSTVPHSRHSQRRRVTTTQAAWNFSVKGRLCLASFQ